MLRTGSLFGSGFHARASSLTLISHGIAGGGTLLVEGGGMVAKYGQPACTSSSLVNRVSQAGFLCV